MKKKLLLILIPILILVIIAVVITVLYFTTDIFKSNKELFWKYLAQGEDITDTFINDKTNMQNDFKENNSYTSEGKLALVLEQGANSSKQLNIETSARHDINTGRTYADTTLKNGEIDLFNVSYINSGDIYAIMCDEIYQNYVGIRNFNLTEMASNYGISDYINVPDSIDFNNYTNIFELTSEQKEHIVNTYSEIILNNIQDTQYEKETNVEIQIGDNSYNTNQYMLTLNGENVKNIILNCLNYLKSDTETLLILSNKFSILGLGVEYTDTTNLLIRIDELVQKIEETEITDSLEINVYENESETIRINIEFGNYIISYDKIENTKSIDITFDTKENSNNVNENYNANEIIDLNNEANMSNTITSEISISKTELDNMTTISTVIRPNIDNSSGYIEIVSNIGSIQNDGYSNSYIIEINDESESGNIITIDYNTNTVKAEQVEEILELNNTNTAIANDYTAEQFTSFINAWTNLFVQTLTSKLETIGFEIN